MASFNTMCLVPQLSTRLLAACHIFRNDPTSTMKLYVQKYQQFCAVYSRNYCTLQTFIQQPCLASHCPLTFSPRTSCSISVDLLPKHLLWPHHNITERNISSQNISYCPAKINDYSNTEKKIKSSPSSKKSLSIEDDELMFFDQFMEFDKNDEDYSRASHSIPIQKDYFCPTRTLNERTREEIKDYLKLHNISLNKADIPPPVIEFSDVEFPAPIMKLLKKHYSAPTAVQAMGWSLALSGRDMIGIGQTGSGKTLGYVVPGLLHTAHQQRVLSEADPSFNRRSPVAVVLAPSRELATQIARVANEYGRAMGIQVLLATGGVLKRDQLKAIKSSKPKFVVATPGRLLDLLQSKQILLGHCSFLVLDEADTMLNMGFEAQIRSIMQLARSDRQTLLWSATWPSEVEKLASSITQEDAVRLAVGSMELRANPDVKQHVHVCEFLQKKMLLKSLLHDHLERDPNSKVLLFVQTKRDLNTLSQILRYNGFTCDVLHADLEQPVRDVVLANFRKGKFSILIATDVAARGLDIKGLNCVINYDFPNQVETYIHRIGRTGRSGQPGVAHTFFSQRNVKHAVSFVRVLRDAGQKIDNKLLYMAAKSQFLPESKKEIFLPFVPLKTSEGHRRTDSMLSGPGGRPMRTIDPESVPEHQYVTYLKHKAKEARLRSEWAKKDPSKVVNTKYVFQTKQ